MPWWRGRAPHPDLAETIRGRRVALGLTQVELAARVGCDQSYISRLEAGQRCPSAVEAGRFQAILAVPIPMPAIAASELSRGSLNKIRKAQAAALAALEAQKAPPPEPYRPAFVNGWRSR